MPLISMHPLRRLRKSRKVVESPRTKDMIILKLFPCPTLLRNNLSSYEACIKLHLDLNHVLDHISLLAFLD